MIVKMNEKDPEPEENFALERVRGLDNGFAFAPGVSSAKISDSDGTVVGKSNMSSIVHEVSIVFNTSSTGKQAAEKCFRRV